MNVLNMNFFYNLKRKLSNEIYKEDTKPYEEKKIFDDDKNDKLITVILKAEKCKFCFMNVFQSFKQCKKCKEINLCIFCYEKGIHKCSSCTKKSIFTRSRTY